VVSPRSRRDLEATVTIPQSDRPRYHLTPPSGWLNDPNGLVHVDGEWHLFYQHHPGSTVWGPMHWGHAVSRDLVVWEHLPIALEPDELGTVFSGSVVVDRDGTAGYGRDVLLAFYTHHREVNRGQGLAYSRDAGRTWAKHPANPLLLRPDTGPDFRDPKVFRYTAPDGDAWWVMVLSGGGVVRLYRSRDLLRWTPASSFGAGQPATVGVFETPDLFELPVDGGPDRRWVLTVGHLTGGPQGGSGTRYLLGSFDGKRFVADGPATELRWADHGADFYAAQSWTDAPDGRRVWLGWMNNWAYANVVPATTWRGMMSTPRELRLVRETAGRVALAQLPVRELDSHVRPTVALDHPTLDAADAALAEVDATSLDLALDVALDPSSRGCLELSLRGDHRESGTTLRYDGRREVLEVDRRGVGPAADAGVLDVQRAALPFPADGRLRLRVLLDQCSIEVFADDGRLTVSDLIFPATDVASVRIVDLDGAVVRVTAGEVVPRS
jgi:fructan beta-fructosidase